MEQKVREQLAARLRERMTASNLNQQQLAEKLGMSKSMVSEILAGRARAGLTPVALKVVRAYPDLLSLFLSDIGTADGGIATA